MSTTTHPRRTEVLPHEALWSLANAAAVSRSLQAVAELAVADHIDDDPVAVEELARRCAVTVDGLDRVLRLLAAHGVFARRGPSYEHTETSRLLRSDHPMSMRPFVRMMGRPAFWASFGALDHSIHTGAPGFEMVDRNGLWTYLRTHPEEARVFDEAMTAKAQADIVAVLTAYDFGRFGTIADIGGGRGHLLRAVLDRVPTASGMLFDLPGVTETLDAVPPRLSLHPGDFFVDPLPRADAYVLMEVLHDWSDAEAAAILQAVRSAARPGATLLIIEAIIPDGDLDPRVHALDVIMLAVTGGRERTAPQLASLLEGAGFRATATVETGSPIRILEATAV
ncbi:MAG: methyltransferase [Acidimicrobiales bacterium]